MNPLALLLLATLGPWGNTEPPPEPPRPPPPPPDPPRKLPVPPGGKDLLRPEDRDRVEESESHRWVYKRGHLAGLDAPVPHPQLTALAEQLISPPDPPRNLRNAAQSIARKPSRRRNRRHML